MVVQSKLDLKLSRSLLRVNDTGGPERMVRWLTVFFLEVSRFQTGLVHTQSVS